MKFTVRILAAWAALTASPVVLACPQLLGTWRSSKALSMAYNEQFAQLGPKQKELLVQILGRMTVTVTEKTVREHGQQAMKVTVGGKESDFAFEELSYPYHVLSCDPSSAEVVSQHPYVGAMQQTVHFVDKDTYWLSPQVLASTREYFVRVRE